MGFSGGSVVKNSPFCAGDMGSILGLGRSPGEGNGNPLPVFLPGKSHGQRKLVGYNWDSPEEWGAEEGGRGVRDGGHLYTHS